MSIGTEETRIIQKAKSLADKIAIEINKFSIGDIKFIKYPKQALLEELIKELQNRV